MKWMRYLVFLGVAAAQRYDEEDCPLIPECCEEDCCGQDTSWVSPVCVPDFFSSGFLGVYSPDYLFGCVGRECCESDCCGDGTIYDTSIGFCIPTTPFPTGAPTVTPFPTLSMAPSSQACGELCLELSEAITFITEEDDEDPSSLSPTAAPPLTAPDTWKPYPNGGTSTKLVNALYCWADQGTEVTFTVGGKQITADELAKLLKDPVIGPIIEKCLNRLDTKQEDAIIKKCNMKKTKLEKALCAAQEIRAILMKDAANVCRHYAFELDQVLERMGCTSTMIGKSKVGETADHAWTEFMEGGKRYLMDVYNGIYICVG
jgi:hypothetical protein